MKNSKTIFVISIVLLLGLFLGGAYFYKSSQSKELAQTLQENKRSLERDYSPSIGSEMLRVTLVEFLDPECESCRKFHPVVKSILKKYEGKVRYVVRYAPFHKNSKFAIKILEAARRQGKYWETLDLLFEKLPEWGSHHDPKPELIWDYLPQLQLDIARIKVDIEDKSIDKMIEQEVSDGAKFQINGTPSFFINGEPLKSFGPQYLMEAIEAALN